MKYIMYSIRQFTEFFSGKLNTVEQNISQLEDK